ncbi:MAG: UDP-N-acetylglucosamine 1-carboxyvinyltransferase [Bdellovibrionota bacterium]|nr:UDP-N-acetylglucosamine 1-carboxyvinyltransferase [Bdellovibrionota bacterium]
MDKLKITGPNKLKGDVSISASKNATLPILAATLLFPEEIEFTNLPGLSDINFFLQILESLGAKVTDAKNIDCETIDTTHADYDLVRKMRASILVLGPLLSRCGEAEVSLPGGCAIGSRPVDIHLTGMEALGAEIILEKGYVKAKAARLKGAKIELAFPSVGATENLMMAAVWAEGDTVIDNAAREPEIEDLANFLIKFGCDIQGAGTSRITIKGRDFKKYKPAKKVQYQVIGDRIEAATYIIAGLMTDSHITVKDFTPSHIKAVLDVLEKMGAKLEIGDDYVEVFPSGRLNGTKIDTAPYPGFPTDVQAQLMALMGVSNGLSFVRENIFENRFMHVPELVRMGMDIELEASAAIIEGVDDLSPAPVMCTDLRASAALILAALVTEGESEISRIYHLDRGYENLCGKLKDLGAKIERVK